MDGWVENYSIGHNLETIQEKKVVLDNIFLHLYVNL